MGRALVAAVVGFLLSLSLMSAQLPVIERGTPTTLRGEIVEISCYQKKGVAEGTGAGHVACALDCARQGRSLGLLSEGDGLFRLVGSMTDDNNAGLVPFLGETVELTGIPVLISNSYDIRQSLDVQKVTPVQPGS